MPETTGRWEKNRKRIDGASYMGLGGRFWILMKTVGREREAGRRMVTQGSRIKKESEQRKKK